jgi:hypothetical protein
LEDLEVSSTTPSGFPFKPKVFLLLVKITYFGQNFDTITLEELFLIRNSFHVLFPIVLFLSTLTFFGTLFSNHQVFWYCNNCAMFLDIVISSMGVTLAHILSGGMLIWNIKKLPDPYFVFFEMMVLLCVCGPLATIGPILMIIDPMRVSFNRQFMFEWILILAGVGVWFITGPLQIYFYCRSGKSLTSQPATIIITSSTPTNANIGYTQSTEEVKSKFWDYLIKHYCLELLKFVKDIELFKTLFLDRSEDWRREKLKKIYSTYIDKGSELEINISHEERGRIANLIGKTDNHEVEAFDKAIHEAWIMLSPHWFAFLKTNDQLTKLIASA